MQKLNSTWQYRERKEIHPTRKLKFLFRVIRIQWLENDIWKRLNLFRIFFTRIPSRTKDQLVENTESKIYPTEKTEISFSYDSNFQTTRKRHLKGKFIDNPYQQLPEPIPPASCGVEKDRVLLISSGLIRQKSPRKKAKCVYISMCPYSWLAQS